MHFLDSIRALWFPPALAFGALISATDPIAVIAMLREAGVKGRLRLVVETESAILCRQASSSHQFAPFELVHGRHRDLDGGDIWNPDGRSNNVGLELAAKRTGSGRERDRDRRYGVRHVDVSNHAERHDVGSKLRVDDRAQPVVRGANQVTASVPGRGVREDDSTLAFRSWPCDSTASACSGPVCTVLILTSRLCREVGKIVQPHNEEVSR